MTALTPEIESIMIGVFTKAVGSVFRVIDDKQARAPKDILNTTIRRESLLLALTTAFTTLTQVLFTRLALPVLKKNPRLLPYELMLRIGATCGSIALAEVTSRQIAPTSKQRYSNVGHPAVIHCHGRQTAPLPAPKPLRSPLTFSKTFTQPPRAPIVNPAVYRGTFSI